MNDNVLNALLAKIGNIEARQHAIETELIDYMERNPKVTEDWLEMRLRALEAQMKALKERQRPEQYNMVDACNATGVKYD